MSYPAWAEGLVNMIICLHKANGLAVLILTIRINLSHLFTHRLKVKLYYWNRQMPLLLVRVNRVAMLVGFKCFCWCVAYLTFDKLRKFVDFKKGYICVVRSYLPNPSARGGYDTRSIFKWSLTGLNSEFSFSYNSCLIKAEEPSLSYYLPIAGKP